MSSLDEKSSDDQITIQTQDKELFTTYNTIKHIPYLDSLYSRWHDKSKPLFIDAPSELIRRLLAKYTVINEDFLGLVEPDEKKVKTKLINTLEFDGEGLIIYHEPDKYVIFEYKGLSQTWSKHVDGQYSFSSKNKLYFLDFKQFDVEYLTDVFRTECISDFIGRPLYVDANNN